ncbi:c-type cytochrome [Paraburkholderia adhaesiva]|uniref:c-type cytochrome n=1 Tax=Paraburkholderia adhaesiva TaxID=2883244 RepID=UPI001F3E766F|nr:c-type cytochrome [Paraburkholderia adhaesiva]
MNTRLTQIAAAGAFAASVALVPVHASAGVRVCTMPGSPSTALDQAVARAVFRTAGINATFVAHGIDDGNDDDGISARELMKSLGRNCDVIAGFPRSAQADASDAHLSFSQGYLRSGYVNVTLRDARPVATVDGKETVAATWSSPSQLIAVQQKNARFDLENTSAMTVEAVAKRRAQRAIVWYPAVVAYQRAHPQLHFNVAPVQSDYADWSLVFASGPDTDDLQTRINRALSKMTADGRLASLTRSWELPDSVLHAAAAPVHARNPLIMNAVWTNTSERPVNGTQHAAHQGGGFIKVSASSSGAAPSFNDVQVAHGKDIYAGACAKCHGVELDGVTGPALSGPAFAPASNSHLTIGAIYQYMSTNMPADRPGKLSDDEYADVMAFLLYTNGYESGGAKLTASDAAASTTPLNAGPRH